MVSTPSIVKKFTSPWVGFGMNSLFVHVSKCFPVTYQVLSDFCTFTSYTRSSRVKQKGIDKALKILDFVIPRTGIVRQNDCHQRVIQRSVQDLFEIGKQKCSNIGKHSELRKLSKPIQVTCDCNSFNDDVSLCWSTNSSVEEDPVLYFQELHKRSISPDAATFSSAISSCGIKAALDTGRQLHALSLKFGFYGCIPVGSSLITSYAKYGKLDDAYKIFLEMPVKNTVLWTAIIAGYAQHWQLETCIYLYNLMRYLNLKPNDFTYASLLSVCTNCASLSLGRTFHSLQIRKGFDSCTHVSNALISMYAKCGVIEEAHFVFKSLPRKDLISWNSMIFGYAHHGSVDEALDLLKEMNKQGMGPDAITFLGILSSCRHAGLVGKGRHCFNLMLQHDIKPELDHYACIVDLLGRVGLLEDAVDFIEKMPIPANAVIWGSLLSSCRVHKNVWIGIHAAKRRLSLNPGCAATHVQLANLYASVGCWNDVAKVRKLLKDRGLKTTPGFSWIEIGNTVYTFKAVDGTNSELKEMLIILDTLGDHMRCLRNMLRTPLDDVAQLVH